MASASTTELFSCSVEEFFDIIQDFEKYPEFLAEVKECRVVEDQGNRKRVEYTVSVIKNFSYSIWVTLDRPHSLKWEFASGDVFKVNNGAWTLKDEAGKCRASYQVEAKFGLFVPGPITKALVSVNLPNMMSSFHKRIGELYGK